LHWEVICLAVEERLLLQDALDAADTAMTLQRILDAAEFRSFCNSDAAWSQDLPFQRAISLAYALCGEMAISAMKAASQHHICRH